MSELIRIMEGSYEKEDEDLGHFVVNTVPQIGDTADILNKTNHSIHHYTITGVHHGFVHQQQNPESDIRVTIFVKRM